MKTNVRPGTENELQYLLKRCDEVFGAIDSLIRTRNHNSEEFRSLQAEGTDLARLLAAAIRRKRGVAPAPTHQSFLQTTQPE